jgi:hypothetical protein
MKRFWMVAVVSDARRGRGRKRKIASQMKFWEEQDLPAFWQPRYYDFNVFRGRDRSNPVL